MCLSLIGGLGVDSARQYDHCTMGAWPILLVLLAWVVAVGAFWLVVRPFLRRLCEAPAGTAIWCFVGKYYLRYFQSARYAGLELSPKTMDPRGMILVSNHVSGIDPLLLQLPLRTHIRWMMAADMMVPSLRWFWRQERIIPVCYDARDATAVRTAIEHLATGGVLGVFPEGASALPSNFGRSWVGFSSSRDERNAQSWLRPSISKVWTLRRRLWVRLLRFCAVRDRWFATLRTSIQLSRRMAKTLVI